MKKHIIVITTSHKPSPRTRSFVKDFSNTLPYSLTLNRGKKTLIDLALEAYRLKAYYLLVVGERRGNPSFIRVYDTSFTETKPPEPLLRAFIKIAGVRLTREYPESSRAYNPESIDVDYDGCTTDHCFKLADILIKIYGSILTKNPDVLLKIYDKDGVVFFEPYNRAGTICGPLIRISGVEIVGKPLG